MKTTIEFVTTFSIEGYHSYGQAFIDSFIEHCDPHQLTVYHESQDNVDFHKRLTWRNLDHNEDRKRFIEDHGRDPSKVGTPKDPNSQAVRFCHKVFAVTDAIRRSEADWVIWVDADVEWTAQLTDRHVDQILDGYDVAFLGRTFMPYSECGFVAYRAASRRIQNMAADMLDYYTSGRIFTRPKKDWHDSRCFDICREESGIPPERQNNLSADLHGWVRGFHPWPYTVLREFCKHHKGPARKQEAYGGIVK